MESEPESDKRNAPDEAAGPAAPPTPSAAPSGGDGEPASAAPGPEGAEPRRVGRAIPDLSIVAVAAGLVSLLARPFLMADPTTRYVVLVAAIIALALGVWSLWGALRHSADWALALAGTLTGGLSLYLYVSYVTAPPGAT